jgi:hypothetical protein
MNRPITDNERILISTLVVSAVILLGCLIVWMCGALK